MFDVLISNGTIVTMDNERKIYNDGSIAIEKDRIIDIGNNEELIKKYKADRIIDAKGRLVLLGSIKIHTPSNADIYNKL